MAYEQDDLSPGEFWRLAQPSIEPQSFLKEHESSNNAAGPGQVVVVITEGYLEQEEQLRSLLQAQQPRITYVSGQVPCWYSCRHVSMHRELLGTRTQQAALRPRDPAPRCQHLAPVEYARVLDMTYHRRKGADSTIHTSGLFVRLTLQRLVEDAAVVDQRVAFNALSPTALVCTFDYHLDAADAAFIIKRSYFHDTLYANPWAVGNFIRIWFSSSTDRARGRWYTGRVVVVRDLTIGHVQAQQAQQMLPSWLSRDDIHAWKSPWAQVKIQYDRASDNEDERGQWVGQWELQEAKGAASKTRWERCKQPEDWSLDPSGIQDARKSHVKRKGGLLPDRRQKRMERNAPSGSEDEEYEPPSEDPFEACDVTGFRGLAPEQFRPDEAAQPVAKRRQGRPPKHSGTAVDVRQSNVPSNRIFRIKLPSGTTFGGFMARPTSEAQHGTPSRGAMQEPEWFTPLCCYDVQPLGRSHFCALCHGSADLEARCMGSCRRAFHGSCLDAHGEEGVSERDPRSWCCSDCRQSKAVCAVCGEQSLPGGDDPLVKCSVPHCPWQYHQQCLRPLTQHLLCQQDEGILACPAHACATCRMPFTSGSGVHMRVCWRCPRAYHDACLPEEAERIEGTEEVNTLCECPSCATLYRAARKQLLNQAKVTQQAVHAVGGPSNGNGSGNLTIRDCRVLDDICRQGFQELYWETEQGMGLCAYTDTAEGAAPDGFHTADMCEIITILDDLSYNPSARPARIEVQPMQMPADASQLQPQTVQGFGCCCCCCTPIPGPSRSMKLATVLQGVIKHWGSKTAKEKQQQQAGYHDLLSRLTAIKAQGVPEDRSLRVCDACRNCHYTHLRWRATDADGHRSRDVCVMAAGCADRMGCETARTKPKLRCCCCCGNRIYGHQRATQLSTMLQGVIARWQSKTAEERQQQQAGYEDLLSRLTAMEAQGVSGDRTLVACDSCRKWHQKHHRWRASEAGGHPPHDDQEAGGMPLLPSLAVEDPADGAPVTAARASSSSAGASNVQTLAVRRWSGSRGGGQESPPDAQASIYLNMPLDLKDQVARLSAMLPSNQRALQPASSAVSANPAAGLAAALAPGLGQGHGEGQGTATSTAMSGGAEQVMQQEQQLQRPPQQRQQQQIHEPQTQQKLQQGLVFSSSAASSHPGTTADPEWALYSSMGVPQKVYTGAKEALAAASKVVDRHKLAEALESAVEDARIQGLPTVPALTLALMMAQSLPENEQQPPQHAAGRWSLGRPSLSQHSAFQALAQSEVKPRTGQAARDGVPASGSGRRLRNLASEPGTKVKVKVKTSVPSTMFSSAAATTASAHAPRSDLLVKVPPPLSVSCHTGQHELVHAAQAQQCQLPGALEALKASLTVQARQHAQASHTTYAALTLQARQHIQTSLSAQAMPRAVPAPPTQATLPAQALREALLHPLLLGIQPVVTPAPCTEMAVPPWTDIRSSLPVIAVPSPSPSPRCPPAANAVGPTMTAMLSGSTLPVVRADNAVPPPALPVPTQQASISGLIGSTASGMGPLESIWQACQQAAVPAAGKTGVAAGSRTAAVAGGAAPGSSSPAVVGAPGAVPGAATAGTCTLPATTAQQRQPATQQPPLGSTLQQQPTSALHKPLSRFQQPEQELLGAAPPSVAASQQPAAASQQQPPAASQQQSAADSQQNLPAASQQEPAAASQQDLPAASQQEPAAASQQDLAPASQQQPAADSQQDLPAASRQEPAASLQQTAAASKETPTAAALGQPAAASQQPAVSVFMAQMPKKGTQLLSKPVPQAVAADGPIAEQAAALPAAPTAAEPMPVRMVLLPLPGQAVSVPMLHSQPALTNVPSVAEVASAPVANPPTEKSMKLWLPLVSATAPDSMPSVVSAKASADAAVQAPVDIGTAKQAVATFRLAGTPLAAPASQATILPAEPVNLTATKPAAPTSQAGTQPSVPASQAGTQAAAPASQAGTQAAAPAGLAAKKPAAPASQAGTQPAVPASQAATQPAVPASQAATQPAMPASQAATQPMAPASRAATQPAAAASQAATQPAVSASEAGTQPAAPASLADTQPATPASQAATKPAAQACHAITQPAAAAGTASDTPIVLRRAADAARSAAQDASATATASKAVAMAPQLAAEAAMGPAPSARASQTGQVTATTGAKDTGTSKVQSSPSMPALKMLGNAPATTAGSKGKTHPATSAGEALTAECAKVPPPVVQQTKPTKPQEQPQPDTKKKQSCRSDAVLPQPVPGQSSKDGAQPQPHKSSKDAAQPQPHKSSKDAAQPQPQPHKSSKDAAQPQPHKASKDAAQPQPQPHKSSKVAAQPQPHKSSKDTAQPQPHKSSKDAAQPQPQPRQPSKSAAQPQPRHSVHDTAQPRQASKDVAQPQPRQASKEAAQLQPRQPGKEAAQPQQQPRQSGKEAAQPQQQPRQPSKEAAEKQSADNNVPSARPHFNKEKPPNKEKPAMAALPRDCVDLTKDEDEDEDDGVIDLTID